MIYRRMCVAAVVVCFGWMYANAQAPVAGLQPNPGQDTTLKQSEIAQQAIDVLLEAPKKGELRAAEGQGVAVWSHRLVESLQRETKDRISLYEALKSHAERLETHVNLLINRTDISKLEKLDAIYAAVEVRHAELDKEREITEDLKKQFPKAFSQ